MAINICMKKSRNGGIKSSVKCKPVSLFNHLLLDEYPLFDDKKQPEFNFRCLRIVFGK